MTTTQHAAYATADSVLTTELNSLATVTNTAASAAIDNSTTRHLVADVELVVTYGVAPSVGGTVELYITPRIDGTNFTDVSEVSAELWAVLPLQAVTSAQRVGRRDLPIPPEQFKLFARNRAGQTTAASANTVKIRRHSLESV